MRKMSYLIRQTIQSMYYYKKRYLLYILSFYIGMLLPVLCIANYNYIRDMLHYYLFDGIEQLKKLNRQGMTVVMVTHDTSLAEYGTRIIRVKDGSILSTCD